MGRAERRHQRERIKAKVVRVVASWNEAWRRDAKAIGRYVNHGLQVCSCYMCGNPRRHNGGPTMQERKVKGPEE